MGEIHSSSKIWTVSSIFHTACSHEKFTLSGDSGEMFALKGEGQRRISESQIFPEDNEMLTNLTI